MKDRKLEGEYQFSTTALLSDRIKPLFLFVTGVLFVQLVFKKYFNFLKGSITLSEKPVPSFLLRKWQNETVK